MTVPLAPTVYRYEGNGVTDIFSYPNRVITTTNLKVTILTRATDAEVETLTLTADYTVTIVSNSKANVTITNVAKIPSGTQDILISLILPASQTRSFPRADSLPAEAIELGLDKLTLLAQKTNDTLTRSIRFPDSDTTTDGVLPPKAERALTYLAFDVDGVPIVSASAVGGAPAGAFGATLVATATQGAAQILLNSLPQQRASAATSAYVDFAEGTDNGTNRVRLIAPAALAADQTVTFPDLSGVPLLDAGAQTVLGVKTFTAAPVVVGRTDGGSATAGNVGEVISSTVLTGAAVSFTTAITRDITSIDLPAGEWDVSGMVNFAGTGTTTVQQMTVAINTTSATLPLSSNSSYMRVTNTFGAGQADNALQCGIRRFSLSSTTTVYLVAASNFAVSTLSGFGTITARRVQA